jgi:Nif-specific regulatory protein
LADHFLGIFKAESGFPNLKISAKAMEKMLQYEWPGNVRELRNALERAVVMGNGKEILPEDLPITHAKTVQLGLEVGLTLNEARDWFEKQFVSLNLKHAGGDRGKAAKVMSQLISKYRIQEV